MANLSPTEKLSKIIKLAFGAGDLGPAIVTAINGFFLSAFLLDVAGVGPATAGLIFPIVKIWDAVNDSFLGSLSDRTKSKWGRRRPRLLFAAIPFGLAFFLQWIVPPSKAGDLIGSVVLAFDPGCCGLYNPYGGTAATNIAAPGTTGATVVRQLGPGGDLVD